MVGCEKERRWGGLSRATLNELNLVLQAGRFYQMQSDIYILYIYIYIDLQSWIIWSKTFIATQSFMLLAKQSSGNCQK